MTEKTPEKIPTREETGKEEKDIRDKKTEREIDKTVEDTFPASDPPSTY